MGTKIAVTKNGVHKIGKKLFLTDENHVHRKAKKAFLTKDGVHRLVYSSGTAWEKWECDVYTRTYADHTRTSYMVGNTTTDSLSFDMLLYENYDFDRWDGFGGAGNAHHATYADGTFGDFVIGYYIVYETEVYKITSLNKTNGSVTCVIVDACDVESYTEHEYRKGSDYFGTVEAEEGALPEAGELVDGSPTGAYCVLYLTDDYYYYVRGD